MTPLARGVAASWQRLIRGDCGVRQVTPDDIALSWQSPQEAQELWRQLPSKVAAFVPRGKGPTEFDEDGILGKMVGRVPAGYFAQGGSVFEGCGWEILKMANNSSLDAPEDGAVPKVLVVTFCKAMSTPHPRYQIAEKGSSDYVLLLLFILHLTGR